MSTKVIWVPYGRSAAEALRDEIAEAKGDDPLAPVHVVVSSNHIGVGARRQLGSGALGPVCGRGVGLAAVTFLTVYRMAELLGAAPLAAQGRRPVSTPVIGAALRAALDERPGVFAPVAEHPATESSLVAAYRELRDLSARALRRLGSRSRRAADVVALHDLAHARLEGVFYDEQDLVDSAIETLEAGQDREAGLEGPVVVYLPQRLSLHSAALLRAVARRQALRVIAGTTGHPGADAEVRRSVARIDDTGRLPLPLGPSPAPAFDGQRTRVVTTSDADEEVRVAVRAVVNAARTGSPLERIAVLYPAGEPYARLAHEHLSAAGIAHNGAAVDPLTSRLAGRTMLGFLRLPEGGYRRDEIFAWLAGGRPRQRGGEAPVAAWEWVSREAGVVAGRVHWDRLLTTYADDREGEAEVAETDPDAADWRAEQLRTKAARARSLREFVLGIIEDLDAAVAAPRPWGERAAWARRRLADLLGSEGHRARWPPTEQRGAEGVERALDRLAALDGVEGPVALEVFTRTLELELEADLGRVGRVGEGVVVGTLGMGVGLDLDVVVVLGMAEGSLPSRAREDSLLPDAEREATGDELPRRSDETERQHHDLLAALGGAPLHVLCVPRGDLRRNSDRVPSRWVLEIAGDLAGRRVAADELLSGEHGWLEHVASFDGGLRRAAFPATAQEYRLRAMLVAGSAERAERVAETLGDALLRSGHEMIASRRSDRFTRFDGNLEGLAVPSPADRPTSATRLEGWSRCPFAYLVRDVLGVEEVENPEDRLEISSLDLGSLVHSILERFVQESLDRWGTSPVPGSGVGSWTGEDGIRLREIAREECDLYQEHGLVGRPIFWQRDRRRIIADLERFLRDDAAHRALRGLRPVAAELAFGLPGARLPTVSLSLPDGRHVAFRGKADRLDVAEDGAIEVLDYKTGRPDSYRELDEDNPDARGTRLQLVVYGLAARLSEGRPDARVRAEYWFTSRKGGFHRIGYEITPEVLRRVSETVGRIVEGVEGGAFPNHPTASSSSPFVECAYCDPDGLGVVDLRRQVERKSGDPRLAAFLDLAGLGSEDAPERGVGEGPGA